MVTVETPLLECDRCGARRQGRNGQTFPELRQDLAAVGWLSDDALDVDLCPTHAGEGLSPQGRLL